MPSIFSMQTKPFPNLPFEKRFIFRRSYSTRATSPIRRMTKAVRHYSTKSTSTPPCPPLEPGVPNEPYKPPQCDKGSLHDNMIPRFYYTKKDKRCFREVCTEGTPPDVARKVCTRSFSSKSGKKKDGCDPCKKQHKTCPHMKPRASCSDNLADNPCGEVRPKNEVCGNKPICTKPTRQDCDTD